MAISKYQNIDWATGITSVSAIAKANIASIDNIAVPGTGTPWRSNIYDFNSETRETNQNNDWSPSAAYAADGWANGQVVINGSQWTSGVQAKGVNSNYANTPSSFTGPAGGMTSTTNGATNSSSTQRYLYKETSGGRNIYDHVCRTPGYNFSSLMNNTSNNLRLVMWYHAYGNTTWSGNLFQVFSDTGQTSTGAVSTTVYTLPAAGNTMAQTNSPYIVQNIDLNAYRTSPATYYFYLLLSPQPTGTTYRHDTAIDTVYFEEY